MDNNEKAKVILDMAQQAADEFRAEGKTNLAERTLAPFKDVPVGSLAKFYDILMAHPTKQEALRSMGVDA